MMLWRSGATNVEEWGLSLAGRVFTKLPTTSLEVAPVVACKQASPTTRGVDVGDANPKSHDLPSATGRAMTGAPSSDFHDGASPIVPTGQATLRLVSPGSSRWFGPAVTSRLPPPDVSRRRQVASNLTCACPEVLLRTVTRRSPGSISGSPTTSVTTTLRRSSPWSTCWTRGLTSLSKAP